MIFLILFATIFYPTGDVVLPLTNVQDVRLLSKPVGICLKIDGEYALYKKIHSNVFVRKYCFDSLMLQSDSTRVNPEFFKFDLNGDGKLEKIRFKNSTLTITPVRGKSETYHNVLSFVFYDIDDNGSLDLIYVDSVFMLHILRNGARIKNYSIVYANEPYDIFYKSGRKTYHVHVLPHIIQGKIPLEAWGQVFLGYNGTAVPLSSGKIVNLNKLENPIQYLKYENDTLKVGISLSEKTNYSITVLGNKMKNTVAGGTLPRGTYRFEYFVGTLKQGKYRVEIMLNDRVFIRELTIK